MAADRTAGLAVESTPTIEVYPDKTVEDRPSAVEAVGQAPLGETAVMTSHQVTLDLVEPRDLQRVAMGHLAGMLPTLRSLAAVAAAVAAMDTRAPFFLETPSLVGTEAAEETHRAMEFSVMAVMAAAAGPAATVPS